MHHLIFQRLNHAERLQSTRHILSQTTGTAIVVSAAAPELASCDQPSNRADRPVIRLFRDAGPGIDTFNPLDVLQFVAAERRDALLSVLLKPLAEFMPTNFGPKTPSGLSNEPSWRILAAEFLHTLIRHHVRKKEFQTSLIEALKLLYVDDVDDKVKSLLESRKSLEPNEYGVLAAFRAREDDHRSVILSTALAMVADLATNVAQRALERTTFSWQDLHSGATLYVEAPALNSDPYAAVLKLWLGALLQLPDCGQTEQSPLRLIVDNPAGLGLSAQLREAQQMPAQAAEIFSFWESLSQLQAEYPQDWSAFVGNCETVEALGPLSPIIARELSTACRVPAEDLISLKGPGDRYSLFGAKLASHGTPSKAKTKSSTAGHAVFFGPRHADRWASLAEMLSERQKQSVIVFESAGECHALTAAKRQRPVYRLDPFGVLGEVSGQFNPVDLLSADAGKSCVDVYQFVEWLTNAGVRSVDSFWHRGNVNLVRGVLQYLLAVSEKPKSLVELWNVFHDDDVVYNLAVVLDTIGKRIPQDSYKAIASFLQCSDNHRSRWLNEINKGLAVYGLSSARRAVEQTTLDLPAIANGRATVYVETPAQHAESFGPVVRLWLSSFLQLCKHEHKQPLLLVVENAAHLGLFPELQRAQQLSSGMVEVWSLWDSPGQLRSRYPAEYSAFLSNCQTVRALGPQSSLAAAELSEVLGEPNSAKSKSVPVSKQVRSPSGGSQVTFAGAPAERWPNVAEALRQRPAPIVVVIESAGEAHALLSNERKENVFCLDPFSILGDQSDKLNPLQLLRDSKQFTDTEALRLAEILLPAGRSTIDSIWRNESYELMYGVMGYHATIAEKECTLKALIEEFSADDLVYNLAVTLDTHGKTKLPPEIYRPIAAFLQRHDSVRDSLKSDATQALQIFADPAVGRTVEGSSFQLSDFTTGESLTVFIELPVERVASHQSLLQLWVFALMRYCDLARAAAREQGRTWSPARFIVDQPFAAALFPLLQTAQLGTAAQVHSFWGSLDQLRVPYAADWSAFLANTPNIEAAGPLSPLVARELATAFSIPVDKLLTLAAGQSLCLQQLS